MEITICGSGAACEQVCPLKNPGRVCPTVLEGIRETLASGDVTIPLNETLHLQRFAA